MYRKKSFISLSLSLMLAMGSLAAPVGAAEFSDGEVQAVQQEAESAQAEGFSDYESAWRYFSDPVSAQAERRGNA